MTFEVGGLDKFEAYRNAEYWIGPRQGGTHFRVGQKSVELDALYRAHSVESCILITAFNPFGQICSEAENLAANATLLQRLGALTQHIFVGGGGDVAGQWPQETSFLALGIDEVTAQKLGNEFMQDAVLYAGKDTVFQLIDTR